MKEVAKKIVVGCDKRDGKRVSDAEILSVFRENYPSFHAHLSSSA
jgi:hypothetical protein